MYVCLLLLCGLFSLFSCVVCLAVIRAFVFNVEISIRDMLLALLLVGSQRSNTIRHVGDDVELLLFIDTSITTSIIITTSTMLTIIDNVILLCLLLLCVLCVLFSCFVCLAVMSSF